VRISSVVCRRECSPPRVRPDERFKLVAGWLDRLDEGDGKGWAKHLDRPMSEYYREHVWVTRVRRVTSHFRFRPGVPV